MAGEDGMSAVNALPHKQVALPRVSTASAPASLSVGTTSAAALSSNANRVCATFVNDSDTVIYLGLGNDAVKNTGIRLNAAGGSFEINAMNMFTGAVNAVTASGSSKVLAVQEW